MSKEFITIKIWTETRQVAKILAAKHDESLAAFLHRLVAREYDRTVNKKSCQDEKWLAMKGDK